MHQVYLVILITDGGGFNVNYYAIEYCCLVIMIVNPCM